MMNCETTDALLDDHVLARIGALERRRVQEHTASCARCADSRAVHDLMAAESIAEPAPELFAHVLNRLPIARTRPKAAQRGRWAMWAAGFAAVVAVVALALRDPGIGSIDEPIGNVRVMPVAQPSAFAPGVHYAILSTAAIAPAAVDSLEVTEFFMYDCYPCYAFEPQLTRWSATLQEGVVLTRVPAIFTPVAELHARAFYAAAALGLSEEMQGAFFAEIHVRNNRLASSDALAEFFARFGVDAATLAATFYSSEVDAAMQRALALGREYEVRATPTLVVAGRYSTNPSMVESPATMLSVVDELIAELRPVL